MKRPLTAALAGLLALASVSLASADGEVGVVIQIGNEVETHCVAYTGDSITGEQALRAAGKQLEQYGSSGGRTVCAIDDTGCSDASSFTSCFCECQGRDCTYWGFFTRKYGAQWVYSTLAFNLLQATDGELHGWKWGAGGPASAPSPVDITFEQVCGHAPRGGALPTATPTTPPVATTTTAPTATAAASPSLTPEGTPAAPTGTTAPASTPTPTGPPAETSTVVVTIAGTPAVPSTGDPGDDGPNIAALIAFAAVSVGLIAAIGGAVLWRRSHGA